MNRLHTAAAALLCAFGIILAVPASAQMTSITAAANSLTIGGAVISIGTATFTPVNVNGVAIAVKKSGGGLYGPAPIPCVITAGALSGCSVPDSVLSTPANILYTIAVKDTSTGNSTSGVSFVEQAVAGISGTSWGLDQYAPAAQTTAYQGIQAAHGPTVPSSCTAPSFFTLDSTSTLYQCNPATNTYGAVTGSAPTPATTSALGVVQLPAGATSTTLGTAAIHAATDFDATGAATAATTAAALAAKIQTATGCNTAGYVWVPQSNTCVAASSPTASSIASVIGTQTGCATAGYVWVPQSNTCVASAAPTASSIASAITSQTGCNTAGYVWSPQSNTCVASGTATASSIATAITSQTGCNTAGYVWSPQSNTCLQLGTASAQNSTAFDTAGAASSAATTAQTNAETYASNASHLTSGSIAPGLLPTATSGAYGAVELPAGGSATLGTVVNLAAQGVTGNPNVPTEPSSLIAAGHAIAADGSGGIEDGVDPTKNSYYQCQQETSPGGTDVYPTLTTGTIAYTCQGGVPGYINSAGSFVALASSASVASAYVPDSQLNVPNGVATLNSSDQVIQSAVSAVSAGFLNVASTLPTNTKAATGTAASGGTNVATQAYADNSASSQSDKSGPIAGTSKWGTSAENGGSSINAVQTQVSFFLPTASNSFQVAYGNAWGVQEANCGPQTNIKASYASPVTGAWYPVFFAGIRNALLDACSYIVSDKFYYAGLPANVIPVRTLVQKTNLSDTATSFPAVWNFGSPNTLTIAGIGGNNTTSTYVDYGEEYKARINVGCTMSSSTNPTYLTCTDANFSSSGNGTSGDVGVNVTVAGAGANGGPLTTTIASVTSSTVAVLAAAASTSVSTAATATITPIDKTLLSGALGRINNSQLFSPMALFGRQSQGSPVNSCANGDSIVWGTGLTTYETGSYFTQGLNQAGVASLLPTYISDSIPFENMSQPSETVAGFVGSHNIRLAMLGHNCHSIYSADGINDLRLNNSSASVVEPLLVQLWQIEGSVAPIIYHGTLMPLSSSVDGFLTLSGQTASTHETDRVAINTWERGSAKGGACLNVSSAVSATGTYYSFTPVAVGSEGTSTVCATYYNGSTVTVGTTGSAVPPGVIHPLTGGIIEIANAVESSQNSGLWAVAGSTGGTFLGQSTAGDVPGTSYTCSAAASAAPVLVSCPAASFTSAINGREAFLYGNGSVIVAGAATYVSATSFTIFGVAAASAVATATNNLLLDGGICGATTATSACGGRKNSGDGIHPPDFGHRLAGIQLGATVGAPWK